MNSRMILYYQNYSPIGDVLAMATCLVFVVLFHSAYISRTKSFRYFKQMTALVGSAAAFNIIYHMLMNHIGEVSNFFIYASRAMFHLGLFGNLLLFVLYMREPLHLDLKTDRRYLAAGIGGFAAILLYDVLGSFLHFGFYIDSAGIPHSGFPVFPFGYFYFVSLLAYMLFKYGNRAYRQVVRGVMVTAAISVGIIILQQIHGQSSFTVATFMFPLYALLYLVHSNPYDIGIGTVGSDAFIDRMRYAYVHKEHLFLMSLYIPDFDGGGRKFPDELQDTIRHFSQSFFVGAVLFQVSSGHVVLCADMMRNPDYEEKMHTILSEFNRVYSRYRIDYKIVVMRLDDRLGAENLYSDFFSYVHEAIDENTITYVDDDLIKDYLENRYILSELMDIQEKNDLNDDRVRVYCQPVYNIKTDSYDTAESLMRLVLPKTGMVYPDKFIPIAEKNKCINTLTRIILYKTCIKIKELNDQGYDVKRISVNFSIIDVRQDDFCTVVEKTIRESGVSFDQVAIEITESQNEQDFETIKSRVNELKGSGIKFYLDDFGTGYSNFERIMELPFDIIKFDRSLVLAANTDEKFRDMITHIAKMFSDMDYGVLYEGVEDVDDEQRCIGMNAKYLQGYKYSKPIPIDGLTDYFKKRPTQSVV